MHGAFYINSGYVGTGGGYFTWKQLHALAADGNEIAGHTLTHRDLPTLSPDEQAREICGDRRNLIQHGFQPVDFAYPFGSWDATTESIVPTCGYQSGRHAWGLWGSGCESTPRHCPYAVDPNNIPDRWAILTADAPIDLTYLINLQGRHERRAARRRLGADLLAPHLPRRLRRVLVEPEAARPVPHVARRPRARSAPSSRRPSRCCTSSGTEAAGTGRTHVPPPPPPPSGSNRLRNPGLERVDHGTGAPVCWELSGGADWSRVPGVSGKAEQAVIGGAPDGYAAIAQPLDQGECSPAVTEGQRFRFSVQYRSDTNPRIEVWARNDQGGWAFWTDGPRLDPSASFTGASGTCRRSPRA